MPSRVPPRLQHRHGYTHIHSIISEVAPWAQSAHKSLVSHVTFLFNCMCVWGGLMIFNTDASSCMVANPELSS